MKVSASLAAKGMHECCCCRGGQLALCTIAIDNCMHAHAPLDALTISVHACMLQAIISWVRMYVYIICMGTQQSAVTQDESMSL